MSLLNGTLLLVDQDKELKEAISVYLSRLGHQVKTFTSAQEALSEVLDETPPVIIASAELPDMPGTEFLRRVKELSPYSEVIMMGENNDSEVGVKCLELDASDYVHKPIKSEYLNIAIKRAEQRHSNNIKIKNYTEQFESLKNTKIMFQQLFEVVPCYISIQDRNLRLTGANRRFKKDFGDHIGSYCYEIYKYRTEPCRDCPVKDTFEDGQPHYTEEVVTSKSGQQYNVLTTTAPIRDSSGEITQVMEMATDISQIRQLQSNLTSLGLLLSSMSHSIRGFLTSLDGGIYSLESGIKKNDNEQINNASEILKKMIHRIRSMVLDILYYTKERDLHWTNIHVRDFSKDLVSIVKEKAKKHQIEFAYEFDSHMGSFEIDPGSLRSALVNIIENSIDACRDDKNKDERHMVIFKVIVTKKQVIFDITDNGIGMDEETKNNMFTLFFSSKGYRGTGLGLFIANRVLEQHGGSIQVESTMGKGSNFKIALPRELPDRIKNDQSQGNNIIKSEKKDLLPNKTKKK
ncbi:MAG: response regulator [Deltaproteobacteria bacterium]|nr:response regulator [Deltaproteobacteria bacterium]MBW1849151.1 response regulator [Deltaproteobacteria bacterium]MBW2364427.1 response regulator [Deltaproteobacteria bacterium]